MRKISSRAHMHDAEFDTNQSRLRKTQPEGLFSTFPINSPGFSSATWRWKQKCSTEALKENAWDYWSQDLILWLASYMTKGKELCLHLSLLLCYCRDKSFLGMVMCVCHLGFGCPVIHWSSAPLQCVRCQLLDKNREGMNNHSSCV